MKPLLLCCISVLSFSLFAQTNFTWKEDLEIPYTDANGNRLTGTEVVHLVNHKGNLYAGNSYWNEVVETRRGQVWVKDCATCNWKRDYQMPSRNSRVPSLFSAIFRTNWQGNAINPDTILLAGSTYDKGSGVNGPGVVFMREDASGSWVVKNLGFTDHPFDYTQIRSMGFYRDRVTKTDIVFAGANPQPLGVYAGRYDATQPGKIRWDATPEFTPTGFQRIMGFAVCNDTLYMATQREVYKRIDGTNPQWVQVLNLASTANLNQYAGDLDDYWLLDEDIRGLRTVKNPTGAGQVLIFGALNHIFRLEPKNNYALIPEKNLKAFLNEATEREFHYIQTQINVDFPVPGTSDTVQFIGFEAFYDTTYLANNPQPNISGFNQQGYYFERVQKGAQIDYFLREILDYNINPQPDSLARVRTFCVSPFPEDKGNVIYAGGFAPWFVDVSNTAWIYKGTYQAAQPNGYNKFAGIQYHTIPGVNANLLSLDVYVPKGGAASKPVMVYVHGGSWRTGDKANTAFKDEFFTNQDYIFVSLNYRLSPNPPDTSDQNRILYPIHPQDVAKAIAWVFNNIGTYGGDTSRVSLIGHSAGAHLVSLVATDESFLAQNGLSLGNIKCTCSLDAGAYDIPYYMDKYIIPRNQSSQWITYVNAFSSNRNTWAQASPSDYVIPGKKIPEFMLVHQGTNERVDIATNFENKLQQAGYQVTAVNAHPLDHEAINQTLGSPDAGLKIYNDTITRFFNQCLARTLTDVSDISIQQIDIQVFPNPSSGIFEIITSDIKNATPASIYNLQGKIVKKLQISDNNTLLDLSELPDGVYILNIMLPESILSIRLVKIK